MINIMTAALILYHLTTLGALGLKKFAQTASIIPLPFVALAYRWYLYQKFERPSTYLALIECPRIWFGNDRTHWLIEIATLDETLQEVYLDPALRMPKELPAVDIQNGKLLISEPLKNSMPSPSEAVV